MVSKSFQVCMGLTLFPSLATQTIMIQLNNMTASYGKWYAGKGQGDISTFNWDNLTKWGWGCG